MRVILLMQLCRQYSLFLTGSVFTFILWSLTHLDQCLMNLTVVIHLVVNDLKAKYSNQLQYG